MTSMVSQITSLTIGYSSVYSGADQRKTHKLRVTGLCEGNSLMTGEFPAQMASDAENVSIWWRHHIKRRFSKIIMIILLRLEMTQIHFRILSFRSNSAAVTVPVTNGLPTDKDSSMFMQFWIYDMA